jgi:signal transduction histidine kinase
MNLIKNAIKFTREGRIDVKAIYNDDQQSPSLIVEISDTGHGIAA